MQKNGKPLTSHEAQIPGKSTRNRRDNDHRDSLKWRTTQKLQIMTRFERSLFT